MTPVTVFAFRQMIPDTVLTTKLMNTKIRRFRTEFLHTPPHRLSLRAALEIDRLHALLVLFFGQLFIEYAVLFLIQPCAPETIAAPKAVLAELAVTAVGAVLAEVCHVAVRAIDAFRAPLAAHAERQTAAADAFAGVAGVVHVFRVENAEAVVTILRPHRFGVLAVFRAKMDDVIARFAQN